MAESSSRNFADRSAPVLDKFGIVPIDAPIVKDGVTEPSIAALRRRRKRRGEDGNVGYMTLMESDGVLRWELGLGPAPVRQRQPARRAGTLFARERTGEVVRQFKFAELPPNQIGEKLRDLDDYLTPGQGLRVVTPDLKVGDHAVPLKSKKERILLIVHGTFSNCDHVLSEFTSIAEGRRFLNTARAGKTYDQVLAFNHPTLSVSPLLSAAALAQHFRGSDADVDIICHSRGGLVVRWWLEVLDHRATPRGRVVFAGPPLAGTGLASPARLRGALNWLTNISHAFSVLAKGSALVLPAAAPIGYAAGVLFGFFGKLTDIAAKTPIVDAGVAMIPGLAGQSREGANGEILRLRESFTQWPERDRSSRFLNNYYFLKSHFQPDDPGLKVWRWLGKDAIINAAADLVFDAPNDLVVDTSSMASLADTIADAAFQKNQIEDFGTSAEVHHLNYFQQARTIDFIERVLRRP
jgi:hypothetical protein